MQQGRPKAPAPNAPLQKQLYEALLPETKGRAANTALMLFHWGTPGDASAPATIPGMLQHFSEVWNPKTSKPPEQAAAAPPN